MDIKDTDQYQDYNEDNQAVCDDEFSDKFIEIAKTYKPKILKVMNDIKESLDKAGYSVSDPWDIEEWEYWMTVYITGNPDDDEMDDENIDIQFEILDSRKCDGSHDGINFSIGVNTVGGSMIGGMTPYNYTDKVWVDLNKPEEIKERFQFFIDADPDSMVDLIKEHLEEG